MSKASARCRQAVIDRVLNGPGHLPRESRRAAFDKVDLDERARALVEKVTARAWTVTDADLTSAKAAGLTDDEIFELVICAALGQSARQLEAASAALAEATAASAAPRQDSREVS